MRWLLILVAAIVLCGCADRSLAGSYEGKREITGPPHIAGQLAKVELELMREGQFRLLNTSITFEGDWEYKDGKVFLNVKSALGRPVSLTEMPYLVPINDVLEFNDPGGKDPRPVLLRRRPIK